MEAEESPRIEIPPQSGMDIDVLADFCANFRKIAEMAWTKKTSFEKIAKVHGEKVGRFSSEGQCVPTALLLKEKILESFPGVKAEVVLGEISSNEEGKCSHSWLQLSIDGCSQPFIIDLTADQVVAFGVDAPKIVLGFQKELKKEGFDYSPVREEKMVDDDGYKRYELLKKRYERTKASEAFYQELFNQNIYIIGSVASGKTQLMEGLQETFPQRSIDVGKLFRVATYLVLHDSEENTVNPNFEKLETQEEVDRIIGALYRKTRLIESGLLEKTQIIQKRGGQSDFQLEGVTVNDQLDDERINKLVSVIAKSPKVREVIWKFINNVAEKGGGVILTGHSLKDIDVTKYRVLQLTVDDAVAADRLLERVRSDSLDIDQATRLVEKRNSDDKTNQTSRIIQHLPSASIINTDQLTEKQVQFRAIRRIVATTREKHRRQIQQEKEGLERADFQWAINPLLASIRMVGADVFRDITSQFNHFGITEFDVAVQTMITLSGREIHEIWLGDTMAINDIANLIKIGEVDHATELLVANIADGRITANTLLIREEAQKQSQRLLNVFSSTFCQCNGKTIQLPASYMGNPEKNPFGNSESIVDKGGSKIEVDRETGERVLVLHEKTSGRKISIRKVLAEISKMYASGFHYLHEGRDDELVAYGAYYEDDNLPFAWVSYSPVGREYKKDMLDYLGVEPHRVLEMTRAWNACWSPKNTMSVMFSFAHDELQKEWKEKVATRDIDKPLSGIITAINGNLGFRANAFNGVGFETFGLKPANFSFLRDPKTGDLEYMTRRAIVKKLGLRNESELEKSPLYATNKFPLLPTNEMIVLFKKDEMDSRPVAKHQNPAILKRYP